MCNIKERKSNVMKKILTKIFLSLLVLVMMAGIIKTSFNVLVKVSEEDLIVEQEDLNGEDENSDTSTNELPGLDDDRDGPNGIPQLGIEDDPEDENA